MSLAPVSYYVDEAGDGVLFGPMGRDRLLDCLWAVQRCYEKQESRFLNALWPKVSLIHDVDDRTGADYGRYLTRKDQPPDPEEIKSRWI